MLPNSYYVKPCQFSRQPSVITDQRSKWLQPSVKKIVGIKKNSSIENPLVEIPFQINFQQDSGCDLSYSHRTTARNKENIIYRPKWQPSQQSQRSTTPINQKKTEIKIMNTRGCGSVSPLRQRQTSCFKIAEPQIQDMVDNLKQNILRDIQEVTRKYQSSRSPTPLSKQISRETMYNAQPPFNSVYELPFQSSTTKQVQQKVVVQPKARYTQDKQKELLKQQVLEQQSQQLVEQLKQSTLKKPDDHRISFNNSYKFQIDHEQVMKNIQTFYQEVQKKQQMDIPSPFTQLTDEEEHSRSQITINNLSSIIPGLQSKKINVSFESSNQDLQSDCRNTFGPLQLESAIKDSKIRSSPGNNLMLTRPQDPEQSLSEMSDDYEAEHRITKVAEPINRTLIPKQEWVQDKQSEQIYSIAEQRQNFYTTNTAYMPNSQLAPADSLHEQQRLILPSQIIANQEEQRKESMQQQTNSCENEIDFQYNLHSQNQLEFQTNIKESELKMTPELSSRINIETATQQRKILDVDIQGFQYNQNDFDMKNNGPLFIQQDSKPLQQPLASPQNRVKMSPKSGSAKRYEGSSEASVEPLSNKSNRYDQLILNFQSIKQQNKQANFMIETKKSVHIGECSHISDFIIHSNNRESVKQDSVFQQLNIQQLNNIEPTLSMSSQNTSNLIESFKIKNQRTTSFSDFLKTKSDQEKSISVNDQSIVQVKPPGISNKVQISIGFLQYKQQVTN